MEKVPGHILVRSRWVLCNKGDAESPDVRARLVSCELNKGDRNDAFSASTPPLEGKRLLFSRYTSERKRRGKPLRISFVDIRKAYFNALPEREIYMRVPKELGLPPNTVAKQVRCVYGTRDAGKLWEDTYTMVLEAMGFRTGVSNPCIFHHKERDLMVVVHGDDFTTLGLDEDINWFEGKLKESFEIKIRGRLGEGCEGPQEIRILNRVVSVDESGLSYEADPRHVDLLMSSLTLDEKSHAATPGVKPTDRDDFANKSDEPTDFQLNDYSDPDAVIAAICLGRTQDNWISRGEEQVWSLLHRSKRRELETPCNIAHGPEIGALSAMRLTCGVLDTGERFTQFYSWKSESNAHASLRRPWTGMTMFFERSCEKPDEIMDRICALHNQKGHSRRVHFSLDPPEIHEVTPYSETYRSHPHFILANKVGWIRLPARADYFTGQTSVVMSARR